MKTTEAKVVQVQEWDSIVEKTYGKPYAFQQQDGCKERGIFRITIPDETEDFKRDTVPEEVNHKDMGVSFSAWLKRDPKTPLKKETSKYSLVLWWERNFYPDVHMIANDLCEKGIIEKGNYVIEIDW